MTLYPLAVASLAIQVHVAAAVLSFVLGALILFRKKGDRLHRIGGRVWVAAMIVVCLSSFFIHEIRLLGAWSPIHLLSVGTLAALGWGVRQARQGRIVHHRKTMQATYVGALIVAGVFTFLPGRIMYRVLFDGPEPWAGAAFAAAVALAGAWLWRRGTAAPRRAAQ